MAEVFWGCVRRLVSGYGVVFVLFQSCCLIVAAIAFPGWYGGLLWLGSCGCDQGGRGALFSAGIGVFLEVLQGALWGASGLFVTRSVVSQCVAPNFCEKSSTFLFCPTKFK